MFRYVLYGIALGFLFYLGDKYLFLLNDSLKYHLLGCHFNFVNSSYR